MAAATSSPPLISLQLFIKKKKMLKEKKRVGGYGAQIIIGPEVYPFRHFILSLFLVSITAPVDQSLTGDEKPLIKY